AETTCLLSLLDARDEWIASENSSPGTRKEEGRGSVTRLSVAYRRALCECLMHLQRNDSVHGDNDGGDNENEQRDNYESLALIYAMMHLNEIFLLPNENSSSSRVDKLDGTPESLTAQTVRYLRLHHSSFDIHSPSVQRLLDMDQPEYFTIDHNGGDKDGDNTAFDMRHDPLLAGPFPQPFYNLIWHLVQMGQLVSAWAVLTRHSSCRRANEEASLQNKQLSKEAEGWSALHAILLSAPLPGGRGEEDDSGLVDFMSEEQEDEEDDVDNLDTNAHERLMEGISRSAYLLWEARPRDSKREREERYHRRLKRCGLDVPREEVEVLPESYSEPIAMHAFQHWQRTVKSLLTPRVGGDHVLGALLSRFPQLQQILSLLVGSATTPALGAAANPSWSEVLISELLYQRPNIPPADIAVRARVAMRNRGGESNEVWEQMILKVMEGNAANVVYSMFEFGGGSGAALPATLTSLLCNLLIDAGCITLPTIQTELLLSAAESILSSFSIQGQADVGVRTTVRLLLPHSPPQRISGDVCYEPRISATISEAISHRFPGTDAEAHNLLNLTEEMIQRGSVRIADACESLAFSRASHHASVGNWERHVYWLLRGMEVMSDWLPEEYRRTLGFACRRHFDSLCEKSADELLSFLVATRCLLDEKGGEKVTEEAACSFRKASTVLEAVLKDNSMASVLKGHVEVNLLYHIVNIAVQQAKNDSTRTALHVIDCLDERSMTEGSRGGGAVTTLAHSGMYLRLLQIAVAILDEEEQSTHGQMEFTKCAFSVHGIHILMARMTQVLFWEGLSFPNHELTEVPKLSDRANYLSAMRLILAKGLMRAFATNSGVDSSEETGKIAKKISLEEEVAMMLRPSI
ncbi:hypothetical protein HJC23_013480, partial [Cyclotella cryptica]